MHSELDEIISVLNPRTTIPNTLIRVRSVKSQSNPHQNSRVSISFNNISSSNTQPHPDPKTVQSSETPYPELFIPPAQPLPDTDSEAQDSRKTGTPALWLRHKRKESKTPANLRERRYLIFRPYSNPMNMRPGQGPDMGYYFKMMNSDVKLIRYTLEDNGFIESGPKCNNWSIMWHGGAIKSNTYQALSKYQKVNHFPRSHEITRKDSMYRNIARMQAMYGFKNFDFVPKTFIMPAEAGELEFEMSNRSQVWIVKPAASSQGKGIFLATKFSEIPKKDMVVSEYIDNPLLINDLKFDLRVYVAITSIHPLRIYMYKEGLVRFATQKYTMNKNSKFTHLTNYSVNKFSDNFIENKDARADNVGSKWSITALRKLIKQQGIDDERIFDKIKDIIIKTILAVEPQIFSAFEMHVPYRNSCFELLGFDILIDDTLKPWLLEVNLSPSLNCDSPLDQKIKGELISDLFTMTGILSLEFRKASPYSRNKGFSYVAYMESFLQPVSKKKSKKDSWNSSTKPKGSEPNSMTKEEKAVMKETNEEFLRRGNFDRIYPSAYSINYKNYFERERVYNTLVCNKLGKICRKGQGSASLVYRKPLTNIE